MMKSKKKFLNTIITLFFILSVFVSINIIKAETAMPTADDSDWNKHSVRPYLVYTRSDTFGGVVKKNAIHVFAFEGDTICLGTNISNSSLNLEGTGYRKGADGKAEKDSNHEDEGSIDIVMEDLSGNKIPIDITGVKGSKGYIPDVATETLAKNMTSIEGATDEDGNVYKPYTYIVSETGVYTFEFRSFNGVGTTNNTTTDIDKTNGWNQPSTTNSQGGALIAAWDITVFNENGEKETGRTYADYLQLQMTHTGTATLKEKYYVMTNDSYIYEMKFLGIQPYTFSFFANNRGITDIATGNIIYKSVKDLKNTNAYQKFGINYTNPSIDDTDLNKNFYIFFEKPNEDLQGYLYEKAMLPDPATNLKFIKDEEAIEGMGGYFSFDVQGASTATLRLEFNIPGHENEYAPVEISDVVIPYQTSYFYWDGRDGNGKVIPAGDYTYEQLKYTVTTKAGEIHFPLIDVENINDGITFTRINDIYGKDGNKVNVPNSIYEATKNVIYYDETAIYYGEQLTKGGVSEAGVTYSVNRKNSAGSNVATDVEIPHLIDVPNSLEILGYKNISYKTNNEYIQYNNYGKNNQLRIGDHSSTNNRIDYTQSPTSQADLIDYLDSSKHAIGQTNATGGSYVNQSDQLVRTLTGTAANYNSTTDYGIANYWTFTPSQEVEATDTEKITIADDNDDHFNLISRVFYDTSASSGIYNQQTEGDHLLSGVTLNLYRKTTTNSPVAGKSYVKATTNSSGKITLSSITSFASNEDIYELVKSDVTPVQGTYMFNSLEYDKDQGTEYIFQVVRPNTSYQVTSENKTAANNIKTETTSFISCANGVLSPCTSQTTKKEYKYGPYMSYAYDSKGKGTEVQKIVVGGSGIDLSAQDNKTISTIDVGYYYVRNDKALEIKKEWNVKDEKSTPDIVVYDVSYNSNNSKTLLYEQRAITSSSSWKYSYEYLPTRINGVPVTDYFVSTEYYIVGDKIYRHKFAYDTQKHIYESFVGSDSYFSLTDYYKDKGQPIPDSFGMDSLPDFNNDGKSDLSDLQSIPESSSSNPNGWKTAKSKGNTTSAGEVAALYNAVLDRNPGSAVNEITITNAESPGTIEILKYTGDISDSQYLDGATFRIYKGTLKKVKEAVDNYSNAQTALANADSSSDVAALQAAFDKASEELDAIQVGSGSTRVNGRIAFAGLNPEETYTIRERFAPAGYRILEEYYQVDPKSSSEKVKFNDNDYCLLPIGNATASGDLEIRSMIQGRAWLKNDSFDYDIAFNYSDTDKSGVSIDLIEKNLFNNNFDTEVEEFVNHFNSTAKDFTINYDSDYVNNGSTLSADTKGFNELLYGGDETTLPGLMKYNFPAAGIYTFTLKELPLDEDSTLTASTRVFNISVKVKRVLNNPDSTEEITQDNSHLEADIFNITYQDDLESGSAEYQIYAGSTPTFVNIYNVEDVQQKVSYQIVSDFTGRVDNAWLDSDSFTYTIDGDDEITREALINNNIILGGIFDSVLGSDTAKSVTINKTTKDHKFIFDYIEFDNIHFPVERVDETVAPTTQPIDYVIKITQNTPSLAVDNVYKGITYSQDEYKLKIRLINSVDSVTGEVDGIIDEIIMELFKNDESLGKCTIVEELDAKGDIHKTETHSKNHIMTFTNIYKTTNTSWQPIVSKTISGREWVEDDNFKFNISTTDKTGGVTMPEHTSVVITPTPDDLSKDTYTANMETIVFTKPGNYEFNVQEAFTANGMSITSSNNTVNVEITDNNAGELMIQFNGNIENPVIAFVNTYSESGDIGFAISKTLKGRKWSSKDSFKFIITPNETTLNNIKNGVIEVSSALGDLQTDHYEVNITNNDSVEEVIKELQNITINKGSATNVQYSFTIKEDLEGISNIECSSNAVNLDLNVTRKLVNNIPSGELEIVATYAYVDNLDNKKTAEDKVVIPFTNYAYVDSDFDVTTNLEGRDWLENETFKVNISLDNKGNIKQLEGENYETLAFTENDNQETLKFRFYEPGTYTFTINQVQEGTIPSGLAIDSSVYKVKFEVIDGDGKLIVTKTINKDEDSADSVVFTNIYTTGTLKIINTVKGSQAEMNKVFTFQITLSNRSINKTFGDVTFANGVAEITTTGNTTINIPDLPSNIDYEVVELEENTDGFTTTKEATTGTINAGEIINVRFKNVKFFDIPNTGGDITYWLFMPFVALIEILLGLYLIKKVKLMKK